MKTPAPADLQRWSDELARDPGSLAFLPLARAYRRQGRPEPAMRLCLRGLQHHPSHVEGHALLALLYLEAGDRGRAADEWSIVLRLDGGNFEALRGMGFCYLERGDMDRAHQHLERAKTIRPTDRAVLEALKVVQQRRAREPTSVALEIPLARTATGSLPTAPGAVGSVVPVAPPSAALPGGVGEESAGTVVPADPHQLFAGLTAGPLTGALLLDRNGLVLAGALAAQDAEGENRADSLGAVLGGMVDEALRTTEHLSLGDWSGLFLEAEEAVLHVSPVSSDAVVLLVARRDAPGGWVIRSAERAASLARQFLGGQP